MNLVIYYKDKGELISISEGDGSNLSSEDEANGFVDYLYYDVYDIQNLGESIDGGMILLKKPIKDEFMCANDVIARVLNMHYGIDKMAATFWIPHDVDILSGLNEWYELLRKWPKIED